MSAADYDMQIQNLQNQIMQLRHEIEEYEDRLRSLASFLEGLQSLEKKFSEHASNIEMSLANVHTLGGLVRSIVKESFFSSIKEAARGRQYHKTISEVESLISEVEKKQTEYKERIRQLEGDIVQMQGKISSLQAAKTQFLWEQSLKES